MVTSRTQNTRFSIPQWLRHSSSSLVGSASCGGSRFRLLSYATSKRNLPQTLVDSADGPHDDRDAKSVQCPHSQKS